MKRIVVVAVAVLLALVGAGGRAAAETKGLAITPLRAFVNLDAGTSKTGTLTVANHTGETLTVRLFDRQFSVANYTYAYQFTVPQPDLVTMGQSGVTLLPGESKKVTYKVDVPKGTTPGGQYYTLFASATLTSGSKATIQAASLLYVTVNGELHKTTELQGASLQRFAFGKDVSYELQAANTGNVHYFVYVSGQLHGPTAKPAESPVTHLLLPSKVRTLQGTITAPVLPGVYKAEYGYKTDFGQEVLRSGHVVYLPPWSVAFVLLLALSVWKVLSRRRKRTRAAKPKEDSTE